MSNVIHLDDVGSALSDVVRLYEEGKIEGAMILLNLKEGSIQSRVCGVIPFTEQIGMLEIMKNDLIRDVSCPLYEEEE